MFKMKLYRFESWAVESGFLDSSKAGQATGANTTGNPLNYPRIVSAPIQIEDAVARVLRILEDIKSIQDKYNITNDDHVTQASTMVHRTENLAFRTSTTSEVQNDPSIRSAISRSIHQDNHYGKSTSAFKKIKFSLDYSGNGSDKSRLKDFVGQLKYWNDGLRELLPPQTRQFSDIDVQARVLSSTETVDALRSLEDASRMQEGMLYQEITKGARLKGQRELLGESNGDNTVGCGLPRESFPPSLFKSPIDGARLITSFFPGKYYSHINYYGR